MGMLYYAKFSLFHLLTLLTICSMFLGQDWILWGSLLVTGFIVLGDACLGDDTHTPEYNFPWILTAQLYLALPLLVGLFLVSMWHLSQTDFLSLGAYFTQLTGYDFIQAKTQTLWWHYLIAVFFVGLMMSMVGTVTAHELVHRTWNPSAVCIGRWLMAFSFDANFSVEHVYGHHKHVSTVHDPATAPRGRNVYQHILISSFFGNISAWKIEKARLERKKWAVFSFQNVCIRGYLMSVAILFASFLIAGMAGLIFTVFVGLWSKCLLEIVNYMEHYGLQRVPKRRVEPKHSWNTNKRISSWAMFNLTRHSHHHANASVPFHKLSPNQSSPQMISGYLSTIIVAMIPPLWFKLMAPKLAHWDQNFASEQEKALIKQQQNR